MKRYTVDATREITVELDNLIVNIYEDEKFVCYLSHFRTARELSAYVKENWNVTL